MTEEEIVRQLQENTAALKEMKALTERTAHYVKWLRVFDIIKILLILVPLIAAYLYLPRILQNVVDTYTNLLTPSQLLR